MQNACPNIKHKFNLIIVKKTLKIAENFPIWKKSQKIQKIPKVQKIWKNPFKKLKNLISTATSTPPKRHVL